MHDGYLLSALILGAYLLGSIPFALLAGMPKGIDIRNHGSGNLGATNAIRVLGKPIGFAVFLLDFFKGLGPVLLVRFLTFSFSEEAQMTGAFACGVAAVLGHIFPIYLRFKGGKGVATTAGAMMGIRWEAAIISFVMFFVVRKLTGYVSVSSMALVLAFPIYIIVVHSDLAWNLYAGVLGGCALLAVIIFFRHMGNWVRIMKGEEPKVSSGKISTVNVDDGSENHEGR